MNLLGKQQIWKDYQKEIADDKYFYARSCIRQTFFPGSEWAYLDILRNKLQKEVVDDPRHTTWYGHRISFGCRSHRDHYDSSSPWHFA